MNIQKILIILITLLLIGCKDNEPTRSVACTLPNGEVRKYEEVKWVSYSFLDKAIEINLTNDKSIWLYGESVFCEIKDN